jgi:acetyl-CoA carboxylase carboxyl transferase subunit alpha
MDYHDELALARQVGAAHATGDALLAQTASLTASLGAYSPKLVYDGAKALGLTAHRLKALNLIDKIVNEPLGGAHRDPKQMAVLLKRALADTLRQFQGVKTKDLLTARHEKLMSYGKFKEITATE